MDQILKNRPYIVLHLLSSVDGRIDGSFFKAPETADAYPINKEIRGRIPCTAVLNGAVTAAEIYADGFLDEPLSGSNDAVCEDYIAGTELKNFVVCIDVEGRLKWSRNYIDRPNQPKSHVIEVLTETISGGYLEYLRKLGISYLFAGKDTLDLVLLMKKLKEKFGIDHLMVTGGGVMDWSLLDKGLLDEISLVVSPAVSGERDAATIFDRSSYSDEGPAIGLELKEFKVFDGGTLWLNYVPKNRAV